MLSQKRDCLPKSAERLDAREFLTKFQELFQKLENSFLKFERLQVYQEPNNTSYLAWIKGDKAEALRLIDENIARDSEFFTHCARQGVNQVRLRAVELPLTSYLEWEFLTYQVTARYGQRILIADLGDVETSKPLKDGSDFLIFDGKCILAHDYDHTGLLSGGWFIDEPRSVEAYNSFFRAGIKTSVPLGVFEHMHRLSKH